MTARRPAALRSWTVPLVLSITLHGAIAVGAFGLFGLVEPPRPAAVIPIDLVFAVAPAGSSPPPQPDVAPERTASAAAAAIAVPSEAAAEPPVAVVDEPAVAPLPEPVAVSPPAAEPMLQGPAAWPPLPRHKPAPPTRRSVAEASEPPGPSPDPVRPDPVAALAQAAAAKAPPSSAPAEPAPRQVSLTGPVAGLVPPGWGAPGLANPPPNYPIMARRRGVEGRVVLSVRVTADGTAERVSVATTSGHGLLDEAARRAVERWRFVPGRIAGMPVAASVEVPIVFRLTD